MVVGEKVDLGIAPAIIAAGITAVGAAIGGWLGLRAARQRRIAKEHEAAARLREAQLEAQAARIRAEVERARIEESEARRRFLQSAINSGLSDEELALTIAGQTGDSPSEVLRELKAAKGGGFPTWGWVALAAIALMMR